MKIQKSNSIYEELLEQYQKSFIASSLFSVLWELEQCAYCFNEDFLNSAENIIQKKMEKTSSYKDKDMYFYGYIINAIFEEEAKKSVRIYSIHEDIRHIFSLEVGKKFQRFSRKEFEENPYFKNIKLPKVKVGNFELSTKSFYPYELQSYDVLTFNNVLQIEIPQMGFFVESFEYPIILEHTEDDNNVTWMSITPNEIFTMKKSIENAKGKVLTLGCGLGYFAYMASLKDTVSKVTIVEKDESVIKLFTKYILPQFKNKEKIEIVKADAFDYLNKLEDGKFDYCFADIWNGVFEIETYCHIKFVCKKFKKMSVEYWIETGFIFTIRQLVLIKLLQKIVQVMKSISVSEPQTFPNIFSGKYTQKYVDAVCRKIDIKTPNDVIDCLKPDNILRVMNKARFV